jgi:lipopolysaccharide transport system ATP-binding protein
LASAELAGGQADTDPGPDAPVPADAVVSFRGVCKGYRRYAHPTHRLLEFFRPGPRPDDLFWALRDVSLDVARGEALALIGRNGSGKSTLLQIAAGTLQASSGRVTVRGRIAALLELGSGFNPLFTGRQNVFFNGQILGLTRREVAERFDRIAAFADIGEFLDQPVRTYSTGMVVRLAFAVAANIDPEILVVDEALAVGDAKFQARCMARIRQLREQKVTVLFVSHDLTSVKLLCDRAVLLHGGRVRYLGTPKETVNRYIALLGSEEPAAPAATSAPASAADLVRHGNGRATVLATRMQNSDQREVTTLRTGEPFSIGVSLEARERVDDLVVGLSVRTLLGLVVYGTNTKLLTGEAMAVGAGERRSVVFRLPCALNRGPYTVTIALHSPQFIHYDLLEDAMVFEVVNEVYCEGLADLRAACSIAPEP